MDVLLFEDTLGPFREAAIANDAAGLTPPFGQTVTTETFSYGDYQSVRLTSIENLGGINPNVRIETLVASEDAAASVLQLTDLFRTGTDPYVRIAPIVTDELEGQFGNSLLDENLQPVADNYEDFVLTTTGIMFSFDEGEVAPNAAGAPSATVPYFQIEDILIHGVVQYRKG